MKTIPSLNRIAAALLLLGLIVTTSNAQILFSAGSPYTQNFDALGNSGTAITWTDNSTLPGWYAARALGGPAVTTYRASLNTSGENNGALYSYGAVSATERALGALGSGSFGASGGPAVSFGVRFTNDTSLTISNITVAYTGEQWRNGGNATAQPLAFTYFVNTGAINDPVQLTNTPLWTSISSLDFISPTVGATAAALDGNVGANRISISGVMVGVAVAPGQEIFLRWLDLNDAGNDHGLAVDDLTITWSTIAPNMNPPSITVQPIGVTNYLGNTASFSVQATGKSPLSYQWYYTNGGLNVPIDGATGTTLTIPNLTTATNGEYYVVITNDVPGSITSSNATLLVLPAVVTNIAHLRTLVDGTTYNATDINTLFQVEGIVVTPVNLVSGASVWSFHMEDPVSQKGVDVFQRGGFIFPAYGDRVRVTASLLNFNGLLELNPTLANVAHNIELLDSGNAQPAPNVINMASAADPAYMDAIEGSVVIVSNVYLVNATTNITFPNTNLSLTLSNTLGQTLALFKPATATDPVGQTIPAYCASIRGVLTQNDSTSPYTSNYQLVLTLSADIVAGTPPAPAPILQSEKIGSDFVLTWPDAAYHLQGADALDGGFVDICPSTSPYTNAISGSQKYFRLTNQACP